ncbi:MAG: CotH kinase family protein, partial [Bacteroidales bacterium]|nr:CotH kinase family protein [Bacteroidales bacterium]
MKDKYTLLIFLFISAFCKTGSDSYAADIVISEILAANNTTNYDEYYYNFGDWIEFYNSSASPKNLQGYFLTDDPDNLFKYQITDYFAINPGSQRIFWADEYDSYIHTNFSIDNEGEFIALIDPSGNIVDSLTLPPQFPDVSFGRSPVNSQNWQYFDHPTPGSSNGSGIDNAIFSGEVIFSLEPGFYSGSIVVELSTNQSVEEIRYTLDGSFPAEYSTLYAGPISISKNRVLRARSFTDQMLPSPIKSHSFFIGEDSLTLPAISISTASAYLEDPMIGIYVEGENGKIDNCIDSAMNFNQDWERAVNFEYFLPSGEQVINQVVGVKINGGCSRNVPSKSFAVYARKKYGKNRMEYPFFKNKNIIEYKNLILRNAGNDYYYAYMRDGFMQTLVADVTAIDYQSYQPARIYINGKYWGILNMREKQNEHYLAANHNVDPDRVDLIESNSVVIEGSDEHYVAMMDFLRSHDITDSVNYAYMCSQMDMDQFIDYYIAQIYFENEDWPMHNIKCWRPQTEGAKWRWLLYDTDYGFGRWPRTGNTVNWAFMKDWEPTMLGATLVENEAFRDEFCQRFAARLSTSYSIPRVLHILDSLRSNIDTEMHLHIEKWGSPWAHWHWIDNTQVMDEFALGRGSLMYQQVNDKFHLEGTASLVLSSSDF